MLRPLAMTLLLLVILFGGGLLLSSSSLLSLRLLSNPLIPLGTLTTWLMLMAIPMLARILLHGADQPYLEEVEKHHRHKHPDEAKPPEGENVVEALHPQWRIANLLATIGLIAAILWPFVSALLAGGWSFSFDRELWLSSFRLGLFSAYSIATFLLGLVSLIGTFRSK